MVRPPTLIGATDPPAGLPGASRPAATVAVLLALLVLVACGSISHYRIGALRAYAGSSADDRYDSLTLDLTRPEAGVSPVFCIQFAPESEPVRSDCLTPELAARYLPEFQIPRYWPETWKQKARQRLAYEGNGYYVAFERGRLVTLTLDLRETDPVNPVTRPTAHPPRIGPPDCRLLYELPLDREQMLTIFGPAGREERHREVYY